MDDRDERLAARQDVDDDDRWFLFWVFLFFEWLLCLD